MHVPIGFLPRTASSVFVSFANHGLTVFERIPHRVAVVYRAGGDRVMPLSVDSPQAASSSRVISKLSSRLSCTLTLNFGRSALASSLRHVSRTSSVQLALRVHAPAVDELTVGVRNDQLVEAVDDRADVMGDDGHALAHHWSGTVVGQLQESVVLVQSREASIVARHSAVAAPVVSFAGERFRSRVDNDVFVSLIADDGACDEQTDRSEEHTSE